MPWSGANLYNNCLPCIMRVTALRFPPTTMSFTLPSCDFPALTELMISDDPRKSAPHSSYPAVYYAAPEHQHQHYDATGAPWFIPNWQSTLDPSAAFDAPFFPNATASALWNPLLPPPNKSATAAMDAMFLPRLPLSELECESILCN